MVNGAKEKMEEHFKNQGSQESLNSQNRRTERLAEWVGVTVGALLAAGVLLGSEWVGLRFATELGVCLFFGFLAYGMVLFIGRFLLEGRPFLARTLHPLLGLVLFLGGICLSAVISSMAFFLLVLPLQNGLLKATIFVAGTIGMAIVLIVLLLKLADRVFKGEPGVAGVSKQLDDAGPALPSS